jgi:hypothetical protein
MTLFTVVGVALIAVGIVMAGYGDGLRRAARASSADPAAALMEDPRATLTLRRGIALMVVGLLVAGLGAL